MIVGIGIDITELARIESLYNRFKMQFLKKILTPREISHLPLQPIAYISGRFAAKEACAKALGTGFSHGIFPTDIEIINNSFGMPTLNIFNAAKILSENKRVSKNFISISHERHAAIALVILEE